MKSEKVTVIIPTYKGQDTLERAVKSIERQTYSNIEIIVVDDNDPFSLSRKETEQVISKLNLKNLIYLKHEKNKNGAAARNTGIAKANGEYICFLDDDDTYMRQRIEKSVKALERNPQCGVVFCDVVHFGQEWMGRVYKMNESVLTPKGIMMNEAAIGTGSNLFLRKEIIQRVAGFDTTFLRHQDLEFAIRVLSITKPIVLNEILVAKSFNGNDNQPNYNKLNQVKIQYNAKFSSVIESMDIEEKRVYYYNCYMRLYGAALDTGNAASIKECIHNLKKYGFKYNLKRKVQCVLAITGINHTSFYKRIIKRKNLSKAKSSDMIDVRRINSILAEELRIAYDE